MISQEEFDEEERLVAASSPPEFKPRAILEHVTTDQACLHYQPPQTLAQAQMHYHARGYRCGACNTNRKEHHS